MQLNAFKLIVILLVAMSVSACSSIESIQAEEKQVAKVSGTICPEPRPQMCTRDYRPVCATRDTGVRCVTTPCPSTEEKTYGNACSACADASVIAYREGACDQQKEGLPMKNIKIK